MAFDEEYIWEYNPKYECSDKEYWSRRSDRGRSQYGAFTLSIFDKHCPQCTATHPTDIVRCACGYVFDPFKSDDSPSEVELAAQEEKLYEEYLAARAVQAGEAARVAAKIAAMEPENERKAEEATNAHHIANAAKAELAAQGPRAAQAAEAVKTEPVLRAAKIVGSPYSGRGRQEEGPERLLRNGDERPPHQKQTVWSPPST